MWKIILFLFIFFFPGLVMAKIMISEILPNPIGSDQEEWLEIHNDQPDISLVGYTISDEKNKYELPDIIIKAGEYLILKKDESKITLNNDQETIKLMYEDEIKQTIEYQTAKEGNSYNYSPAGWQWSSSPSPGQANIIQLSQHNSNLTNITGIVISLPGQISSQYFYISSQGQLYQVYSYKKLFPTLKLGDEIKATGKLNENPDYLRIIISQANDLVLLNSGHKVDALNQDSQTILSAKQDLIAVVQGEITKITQSEIYLFDQTGEIVLKVTKALGVRPNLQIKDSLKTVAICQKNKEYCYLLSFEPDFLKLQTQRIEETATATEIVIDSTEKRNHNLLYFLVISLLTGLLFFVKMK
jgi:hypothetical protein